MSVGFSVLEYDGEVHIPHYIHSKLLSATEIKCKIVVKPQSHAHLVAWLLDYCETQFWICMLYPGVCGI